MGAASLAAVLALATARRSSRVNASSAKGCRRYASRRGCTTRSMASGCRAHRGSPSSPPTGRPAETIGASGDVRLTLSGPGMIAPADPAHPRAAHITALHAWPVGGHGLTLAQGRRFTETEMRGGAAVLIVLQASNTSSAAKSYRWMARSSSVPWPPRTSGSRSTRRTGQPGSGALVDSAFFTPQPPGGVGMQCSILDQFSYGQVKVTGSRLTVTPKDIDGSPDHRRGEPCGVVLNYKP